MLLYALFVSFPERHSNTFRFDGRHFIGDVMAHAMIRNICTVNLTDKVFQRSKRKFQRKETKFADKMNHKNSFLQVLFIWVFSFQIEIFGNGKIETPLKSHCVVKLSVDEK